LDNHTIKNNCRIHLFVPTIAVQSPKLTIFAQVCVYQNKDFIFFPLQCDDIAEVSPHFFDSSGDCL